MKDLIKERVHQLYWKQDINCAGTMLRCLGELFSIELGEQTLHSAAGLHGAGGHGAQCGLVEGALMFIGICGAARQKSNEEIVRLCYEFAEAFTEEFGSLRCCDLRPGGFTERDPPHACESLTNRAIAFAHRFIQPLSAPVSLPHTPPNHLESPDKTADS